MAKYKLVACADPADGLPRKEAIIEASSYEEARRKAFYDVFPEYEEIWIGGDYDDKTGSN